MKIHIASNLKTPSSGKGFFCQRLAGAMRALNVTIVPNNKSQHDITLQLIKIKGHIQGPQVLRLDGIYHNSVMNIKGANKPIIASMKRAAGVIYQSNFAKQMCERYLGRHKLTTVILNGSDPKYYENTKPAATPFDVNFLAASRWRPHKRLRDTIESFLLANITSSCLWIAGDLSKSELSKRDIKAYSKNNIKFLGRIDQPTLARYYKLCNAFMHLCWLDWCPNSVVEAISAGCTVICGNQGGTKELVSPSGGVVCSIDAPYNNKPCVLYKPPRINRRIIADALSSAIKPKPITNHHVNINHTAKQYIKFFRAVQQSY